MSGQTARNTALNVRPGASNVDLDDPALDEYARLLAFIESNADADVEEEEDEEWITKRVWYAPWKKRRVRASEHEEERDANGALAAPKVPPEWLRTDMDRGLSSDTDVLRRRDRSGWNELESVHENWFLKFFTYFQGPIQYVMELAVLLAAGLRDWIDFGLIIGILCLNAAVGWYQEKSADDIVMTLRAGIAMKALVVRDGQEVRIEAREMVPGEIFIVEEGETIPADGIILADYADRDAHRAQNFLKRRRSDVSARPANMQPPRPSTDSGENVARGPTCLSCDQSAITGESLAVDKFVGDTIYYTTGVKRGKVICIATSTARGSFVGRTAALVQASENREGHFKQVMNVIGTTLLVLVFISILAVWIGGFFRSVGIATPRENNLLLYTLILLIIGVPVGLPCVTTTTMAVGAAYLAKKKAIVQKLSAIESLAGVDVLCSDKTGTLTANKLSIHEPYCAEGVPEHWLMTVAALASSHNVKALDPIDKVIVLGLNEYPESKAMLRQGWKTHTFAPFDPVSKRITAEVECNGKRYTCCKGAPNAVLRLANPPESIAEDYRRVSDDFAKRGFRSLGVAVKEDGQPWSLLGMIPLFDPPRDDTAVTIQDAQHLGISVKMLTGDAVAIAKETCKLLALGTNVYASDRLISSGMTGSEIHDFVESADGFAEVFPEHKFQVVQMLQARGHLTAMTGDGVNDAPSLKRADCGIAVEGASDAARAAADIVFLAPGLFTIIDAVKVARQIFHRMKAYIIYRIALCLHLEIYLVLSMIILNETIRSELVVFIALFADLATIAIAYDKAPYSGSPVEWQLPKIWVISTVMGILLAIGTWVLRGTMLASPDRGVIANFGSVQEIIYLEVALTENWLVFITRLSMRGGDLWPSWQLVGAVFGVDVLATIFCLFGWLSGPAPRDGWTDIVTVVRVWIFSIGVIILCAVPYYLLCNWSWLDNLGKKKPARNSALEDFLLNLRRLASVHEKNTGEIGEKKNN
ncbi:hypothetical protein CXG81DRAFT_13042 [Caulochytrium protostelioides]|uniref:Plasma membrane ATPase n=1 Tax=Caulochytrium protostelioides TaxID=1555241 RepID=A0A4P9X6H2_9FUNG|nr:plasma-membrane proton-e [Caulochytrium protostelioides]RKP00591.1 hypothetical protein CXG81DRAFT_13042 [Caulochytrium protostelioides]|eukprot:RKP00591.1 hypothetical protein CXG81DRAFT_13042 [Caulochytrium protostelioides]